MLLENTKTKILKIEHIRFMPGMQRVDGTTTVLIPTSKGEPAKRGPLQDHPQFKDFLSAGVFKVITKKAGGTGRPTGDPAKMGSSEAITVIEQMFSIAALNTLIDNEKKKPNPRADVIAAADKQISVLNASDDD